MATPCLKPSFYRRPAQEVAPNLIGCILVKQNSPNDFLWGVVVETEAYSQEEEGCHGFHRRSSSNETLFGEPGKLYVYRSYGIHHCVNIVTDQTDWASGVLLRAVAIPDLGERVASGPGLLSKMFSLDLNYDGISVTGGNDVWIASRPSELEFPKLVNTTRIGITLGKELLLRWYLKNSRSISRRAKGDRTPALLKSWSPSELTYTF